MEESLSFLGTISIFTETCLWQFFYFIGSFYQSLNFLYNIQKFNDEMN
jgi:hypothetical protein